MTKDLLSGNNMVWLIVLAIIIVAIVVFYAARKDDAATTEEERVNNRRALQLLIGVAIIAVIVGALWYAGVFSYGTNAGAAYASTPKRGVSVTTTSPAPSAPAKGRSPPRSPSKSASPKAKTPVARSPPRGSLYPDGSE